MKMFELKNKTVLVTGGYGHVGAGICRAFLSAGAEVIVGGRDQDKFKKVFADLKRSDRLHFHFLDVSDTRYVKRSVTSFQKKFRYLDVLVNNAIDSPHLTQPSKDENQVWRSGLLGNLETVQIATQGFMPLLEKSESPCIINISSMYGFLAPDFRIYKGRMSRSKSPSYYGAAKAGVIQLTKYWASLYAEKGIRVNCISPGPFPNRTVRMNKDFSKALKERTLLARLGTVDEIGGPCVFLASPAASYITGQNLIVDGGWSVR